MRSHQPSVFHLMDRLGYDVVKVESGSRGLPAAHLRRRAHQAARACSSGSPAAGARRACTSGSARSATGRGPTFYFHHALLPARAVDLPARRATRAGPSGNDPIEGINRPIGFHDPRLTDHNHLRHLLQVGYVDRQLGLIMRRHAAHGRVRPQRCSSSSPTTATRSRSA